MRGTPGRLRSGRNYPRTQPRQIERLPTQFELDEARRAAQMRGIVGALLILAGLVVCVVLFLALALTARPAVAQGPVDQVGPVPTTLVWQVSLPVVAK